MSSNNPFPKFFFYFFAGLCSCFTAESQMITGVWKGKINRQKVEVKIVQKGDSLTGTSYYFESANNYRRYSIKGYFDPTTNEAVWWDDQLLEEKSGRISMNTPGKMALLARADFNCPGGGKMMLDGKVTDKETDSKSKGDLHLDKYDNPFFTDEWDFVIDNYTVGGNNPEIIDSIDAIAFYPPSTPDKEMTVINKPSAPKQETPNPAINVVEEEKKKPALEKSSEAVTTVVSKKVEPLKLPSIEEKYVARQKVFIQEIEMAGDSIELKFYDNAEVDGDSISLFLNGKLIFEHIRLTASAYSIKLSIYELNQENELVMVAENMGSIPPNTSYMVAISNGNKQDAYLASTEGSSAMIKLIKKAPSF